MNKQTLLLALLAGIGCQRENPLAADMSHDMASAPDLWMCSDFGQPCGFDGYQCCKTGRFPLTCAGGACTMCAEGVGTDCSTLPCCGDLLCKANRCEQTAVACIACDPTQTSGGPSTPSRCAKAGDTFCCAQ
mgnify:FL=1